MRRALRGPAAITVAFTLFILAPAAFAADQVDL